MLKVVVLPAVSRSTGLGHVRRCQVLAAELRARGAHVELLVPDEARDLELGPVDGIAPDDPALVTADVVIVDSYEFGPAQTSPLRRRGMFVLQVDDLGDRPLDADLVVNPNAYGPEIAYEPPALTGLSYSLVAPTFAALSDRSGRDRVLVSFGGSDDGSYASAMATALRALVDAPIDAVVRPDAELRAVGGVTLRRNADMYDLMSAACVYVGAAGGTLYEASAAGLAVVAVSIASNQDRNAAYLRSRGLTVEPAFDAEVLAEHAARALEAPMPNPLTAEIDGGGGARIVDAVLEALR